MFIYGLLCLSNCSLYWPSNPTDPFTSCLALQRDLNNVSIQDSVSGNSLCMVAIHAKRSALDLTQDWKSVTMIFLVTLAPENHQAWKRLQTHPASLSTNSLHSSQCWLSLLFWLKPQRVSMVYKPIHAHYIFTSNIFIYKLVGFLFYQTIAPISAVCVVPVCSCPICICLTDCMFV